MNVITHTFVGLKCLTETKIQILCDHVDHTRFHIVEMGCQMVQPGWIKKRAAHSEKFLGGLVCTGNLAFRLQ